MKKLGFTLIGLLFSISLLAQTPINYTQQPQTVNICVQSQPNQSYNFTVAVSNTDVSYQWYSLPGDVLLENDENFSGVNSPTLVVNNPDLSKQYYCSVSNGVFTLISSVAGININQTPLLTLPGAVAHWPIENPNPAQNTLSTNNLLPFGVVLGNDRFGRANQAYEFTTKAGALNLTNVLNNSPQSISLWYQFKGTGGATSFNTILGNGTGGNVGGPVIVVEGGSNRLVAWGSAGTALNPGVALTNNQWYHIVYTRESATDIRVYVNGVQINATTNNVSQLFINRIGNNRDGFLTQGALGNFDDIQAYNRVLTQSEIDLLYQENFRLIEGLDPTINTCGNSDLAFEVEAEGTNVNYAWKLGNNLLSETQNQLNLTNYNQGSQTLQAIMYTPGCLGIVSETEIVLPVTPIAPTLALDSPSICANGYASFTITNYNADFDYEVSLPEGWEIFSQNGNKVFFINNGVVGNIEVVAINQCNESSSVAILTPSINTEPLVEISTISGTEAFCGVGATANQTFSVNPVANVNTNGYVWILPEGVTGASTTNSISLNFLNAPGLDLTLKVFALTNNGCSTEIVEKIVSNDKPVSGQPVGPNIICDFTEYTFSAPDLGGSTVNYFWNLPEGSVAIGETNEKTVNFLSGTQAGTISVDVQNTCTGGPFFGVGKVLTSGVGYEAPITIENGIISNATNTFNGYTLYRNNTIVASSDTSGDINFDTEGDCGEYYATFEKTVSLCDNKTVSIVRTRSFNFGSITCSISITPTGISFPATVNLGALGNHILTESSPTLFFNQSSGLDCSGNYFFTITDEAGCTASVLTIGNPASTHNLTLTGDPVADCPIVSNTINVNNSITDIAQTGSACLGNTITLSVEPLAGATYNWILPEGMEGESTTNSIEVEVNAAGLVQLEATNECGTYTKELEIEVLPFGEATLQVEGNTITANYPLYDSYVLYKDEVEVATGSGGVINYENAECGDYQAVFLNQTDNCGEITFSQSGNLASVISSSYPVTLNFVYFQQGFGGQTFTIQGPTTVLNNANSVSIGNLTPSTNQPRYLTFTKPNGCTYTAEIFVSANTLTLASPTDTSNPCEIISNTVSIGAIIAQVSGEPMVCAGSTQTYSVTEIEGATYTWVLPEGWEGNSTSNTIEVTVGSNAGTISVSANEAICGTSNTVEFAVDLTAEPIALSAITGGTILTCGLSYTYSVVDNPSRVSYVWTLPDGTTGSSTTNSITFNFNQIGTLSVVGVGICGIETEAVTIELDTFEPTQPGIISANGTAITELCADTEYTLNTFIGNPPTSFVWTLPEGWLGNNSTTNTITITTTDTGGTLSAQRNVCGKLSQPRIVEVTVLGSPDVPTFDDELPFIACQGQTVALEVLTAANATLNWVLPSGLNGSNFTNSGLNIFTNQNHTFADTIRVSARFGNCPTSAALEIPFNVYNNTSTPLEISNLSATTVCLGDEVSFDFEPIILSLNPDFVIENNSNGLEIEPNVINNTLSFTYNMSAGLSNFTAAVANICNRYHIGEFQVTYNPLPEIVITQGSSTLNVSESLENIQWFYSVDNSVFEPVDGANNSSFEPTLIGWYKVEAESEFGCVNVSEAYNLTFVSVNEFSIEKGIKVFPNPVSDLLNIEKLPIGSLVKLIDVTGKEILAIEVLDENIQLNLISQKQGLYLLQVVHNNQLVTYKVVKK